MYSVRSRFLVHRSQPFVFTVLRSSGSYFLYCTRATLLLRDLEAAALHWLLILRFLISGNFTFCSPFLEKIIFYSLFIRHGWPLLPRSCNFIRLIFSYLPGKLCTNFLLKTRPFSNTGPFCLKMRHPPIPLWNVLDVLLSNLHQRGTNFYGCQCTLSKRCMYCLVVPFYWYANSILLLSQAVYTNLPTVAAVFFNCEFFFLDIKGSSGHPKPSPGHGPAPCIWGLHLQVFLSSTTVSSYHMGGWGFNFHVIWRHR